MHIVIATPAAPPCWALLQRHLLREASEACREFHARYFDVRGYLECVPRWGGDDGPDDAAENLLNWTMLHALGGADFMLDLYRHGWEGHLRQYTEARTVEVPLARDGMYYKEFPVMFDWFHNGEGYSAFFLEGLSDPGNAAFRRRTRRFAGFYLGEEPGADNFDPERCLVRSMFNGSRGPLLRKATALDWAGDPIEIEGRFRPGHGEASYAQMLDHFREYNDVDGDSPLNFGIITLMLNAFMLEGEAKYRDWIINYMDRWVKRTQANGGLIPTIVGTDGAVGSPCGGRWYGGVYGWGFTVTVPQTGDKAHRPFFTHRAPYGFGNALLLTGDRSYVDTWRGVIQTVNAQTRMENGRPVYPRMYGDEGWYDFRPEPFAEGALETFYWTQDAADLDMLDTSGCLGFWQGQVPDWPVQALQADLAEVRTRIGHVRRDTSTPDTRLSDDMNTFNPAITEALTATMLGGLPTGRVGSPLHCQVRYFDPDRRRAGLPADVASLVHRIDPAGIEVELINLSQVHARNVCLQLGAYGEHQCLSVCAGRQTIAVDEPDRHDAAISIRLEAGCGQRLTIEMDRYRHWPTLAFPWQRWKSRARQALSPANVP